MKQKLIKYALPILILIAGFIGMRVLVLSRTPPEKQPAVQKGILVKTIALQTGDYPVSIHGTGTVQAAVAIPVLPQVSGRVVQMNPHFKEGGFIKKGEMLFSIEDTDYRLAVEKSRASIAKAEYDLASVESQARIAKKEWDRVHLENKAEPNPLVLYTPQMKNAKAALAGVQADLAQRQLDLERTTIRAPFNCRISSKNVDLGQFVAVGQNTATIAGTDMAEVVVPVTLEELQWLEIPNEPCGPGSSAEIKLSVGTAIRTWKGVVDRSLGEADSVSRMIRLVINVRDPYGLSEMTDHGMDLAEGLFVDVTMYGKTLDGIISIPTSVLRQNDTVWGVGKDNKLEIHPVTFVRREKDTILVRGSFPEGYQLISTNISGASPGMRLRIAGEDKS